MEEEELWRYSKMTSSMRDTLPVVGVQQMERRQEEREREYCVQRKEEGEKRRGGKCEGERSG
jgi:hypothetical protein